VLKNIDKKNLPQYTGTVSLQQLIYDFGKSSAKASASRLGWGASKADSQNIFQNIIYSAITSYFAVAQAKAVFQLSEQAYKQSLEHFKQTQNFFDAGRSIRYALVRAQIDTSSARLAFIRAKNGVAVSTEQLAAIINVPLSDAIVLSDSTVPSFSLVPQDSALAIAFRNRSDLEAAHLRIQAYEQQIIVARKSHLPNIGLTAAGGYRITNSDTTPFLNAGLFLSVPITSGGSIRGSIMQNTGNLNVAKSTAIALKQSIQLEIKQQYLNIDEIQQRIAIAGTMQEQAGLALTLAKERYNAGAGNSLEIIDAEAGVMNAGMSIIQAHYDYAVSCAKLQKILGTLQKPGER
jgi:outer membrane protein TolC